MTEGSSHSQHSAAHHGHGGRHADGLAPTGQGASEHGPHAHSVSDFRRRFWIAIALTVPVVLLSRMIQHVLGLGDKLSFPGDQLVQSVFASAVFFYGGWPFLNGLVEELKKHRPGMMTLIGLATGVAYFYSTAVAFGAPGRASIGSSLPSSTSCSSVTGSRCARSWVPRARSRSS